MTEHRWSQPVRLAAWLLAAAVVLAIVGLVVKVLRWLLVLAALLLLGAAAVRWLKHRRGA